MPGEEAQRGDVSSRPPPHPPLHTGPPGARAPCAKSPTA
eukprot:CAMPEP_0185531148 /NCGR_PEP_ID=MMETSP1366-20130426/105896_1 /TAXON_ID=38817 /ORGANISM="Gephyrocapsa oceanica, Strain RCC1303" /LENGTH=38 /DNA_ID= /DNA_START= /DNA_END= /DNA_ORIENTATION=